LPQSHFRSSKSRLKAGHELGADRGSDDDMPGSPAKNLGQGIE
jgi:hypothetical protein